jgi:hypothetical protein
MRPPRCFLSHVPGTRRSAAVRFVASIILSRMATLRVTCPRLLVVADHRVGPDVEAAA